MRPGVLHFLRYRVPALLWACIIFAASSIPSTKFPQLFHRINDKVIHAAIFCVLGLLVYRALEPRVKATTLAWGRLVVAVLIVSLYGLSDEFHQRYVPGRSVDVLDFTADTVGGILAAAVIYSKYRLARSSRESGTP